MTGFIKIAKAMLGTLVPLIWCVNVFAQTKPDRLDSLFTMRHKEGMFNGNVLVAENGQIIYQQAFGFANLEKKIRSSTSSRSGLGSVSKLFTAVAIL